MFITAINLVPIGQLDGGHIAYALLGPKYNRYATWLLWMLPLVFAYNLLEYGQFEPGIVWLPPEDREAAAWPMLTSTTSAQHSSGLWVPL